MPGTDEKMFNKKSHLGKEGSLTNIALVSAIFSFMSIIYVFIAVFGYVVANDYIFYNMQNLTEELESDGIIKGGTAARTQTYGEQFQTMNLNIDNFWLIAYIVFIVSSLMVAYKQKSQNYFGFLSLLFYGIMVYLFTLTIFSTLTDWFKEQFLNTMIPTAYILVPKFYYYVDHLGIFSLVHILLCLLVNMLDFDFAKIFQKKQQEKVAMQKDNEVV